MTIWGLIQVVIDIFLFVGLFVCIVRSPRTSKDDPRLSRGLQLLQSKISVLEDLSDKTDVQFQKIMSVLEQKVLEVKQAVATAERQLFHLQDATAKGIETTRLVQTGLGAEQVIERHTNEVYARAAQLAFEGQSIDEICEKLELSRGEVELIVKFNRDSLRTVAAQTAAVPAPQKTQNLSHLFEVPQFDASSLNKIGDEFRRVSREAEQQEQTHADAAQTRFLGFTAKRDDNRAVERAAARVELNEPPVLIPPNFQEDALTFEESVQKAAPKPAHQPQMVAAPRIGTQARELNSAPLVRKVVFPRIEK